MSAPVLSLATARLRRLAERFLTLQTAIDDGGGRPSLPALQAELDATVRDASSVLAQCPGDELGAALARAIEARAAWCDVEAVRGPGPRADDAADTFTLALIELALRLRGRPRRAAAAALTRG